MIITNVVLDGIQRNALSRAWPHEQQLDLAFALSDFLIENETLEEKIGRCEPTKDWTAEQQIALADDIRYTLRIAGEAEAQAHEEWQARRAEMLEHYRRTGRWPWMAEEI